MRLVPQQETAISISATAAAKSIRLCQQQDPLQLQELSEKSMLSSHKFAGCFHWAYLHCDLQVIHIHIEFQEIAVKSVVGKVKEIIWPPLDIIHNLLNTLDHATQTLNMGVLCQAAELVNGAEQLLQLAASTGKQLILPKNLGLIKGKCALLITSSIDAMYLPRHSGP